MNNPAASVATGQIKAIRGFNRFYTQRIGVLSNYLGGDLSLTEVRVLYDLAHRQRPTATELARDLALDAGYLSRILRRFETRGWLARKPSPADARQSLLQLTDEGHAVFAPLQQKSRDEAANLLESLPAPARGNLIDAMRTVQQHGEIYWREYGYTIDFEGLVAGIAARFIERFNPAFEKGWIAELDGKRVGCVFVVRKSSTVAQLRLLILTPGARGQGLGGRLTDECIAFARNKGYRKMVLWTNGHLDAARAVYKKRGFLRVKSEPLHAYGQNLIGETWELRL